jgi:hypothetical protein
VLLTILWWPTLGPHFWPLFSSPLFLALIGGAGTVLLLAAALLLRLVRGVPAEQPTP